jgi:hypothetical protein
MSFVVLKNPAPAVDTTGPVAIYALIDPRDWTVRYVGMTGDPGVRLSQHLADKRAPLPKREWIAELKSVNLQPLMVVLARASEAAAPDLEREHIAHFSAGGSLYNIGGGRPSLGDEALLGRVQIKLTEEEADRFKAAAKRLGISVSVLGRRLIQAWLAKTKATES